MRVSLQQDQHPWTEFRYRFRVVQRDVQAPRATRAEETLELRHAGRRVQPQRDQIGIEDPQFTTCLREQAIDRLVESRLRVEKFVA